LGTGGNGRAEALHDNFTKSYTHKPFGVGTPISTDQLLGGLRLAGALLIATLVPFLIDRHARRSTRIRQ
jgi:hypothetical protein